MAERTLTTEEIDEIDAAIDALESPFNHISEAPDAIQSAHAVLCEALTEGLMYEEVLEILTRHRTGALLGANTDLVA